MTTFQKLPAWARPYAVSIVACIIVGLLISIVTGQTRTAWDEAPSHELPNRISYTLGYSVMPGILISIPVVIIVTIVLVVRRRRRRRTLA